MFIKHKKIYFELVEYQHLCTKYNNYLKVFTVLCFR